MAFFNKLASFRGDGTSFVQTFGVSKSPSVPLLYCILSKVHSYFTFMQVCEPSCEAMGQVWHRWACLLV